MENNTPKEANMVEKQGRNRKMLRVAGIIIILGIIAALIGNGFLKRTAAPMEGDVPAGCKPGDLFSETTGKPCPQQEVSSDEQSTVASVYEEAIRTYAGKLVVLDANCKALPTNPVFTAGTRILVANNAAKAATVSVAGRTESLDGYHYFTVTLPTKGDVPLTCNSTPAVVIKVQ